MGPLDGVRVIELAGLGPGPFAAMMLADMGAEVVRIDRAGGTPTVDTGGPQFDLLNRGRRSIAVDLKQPSGVETVLALIERADALVEGFRPGVTERLGLGPDVCLERNPRLVYGRMTGWGQEGPLAPLAGHDVNYIAIAGALGAIGRPDECPQPPLNLVGDFGGGGMLLAFGVVCAVLEARSSDRGQVVDAAMVDGTAVLTTMMHGLMAGGRWRDERGVNLLDSGAPFYDVYECADGGFLSVGAIEPQFYALAMEGFGLADDPEMAERGDPSQWPALKERLATVIATRTRDEWAEVFADSDACVAPVLSLGEATRHPHLVERGTFVEVDGVLQPAPAPRFSRTAPKLHGPPPTPGQHTDDVLRDWGVADAARVAELRSTGAVA
ncbi:MAG TPA: CaiB/BaiF CoA-transferase family protein [Acidimicrobiales bacterium]